MAAGGQRGRSAVGRARYVQYNTETLRAVGFGAFRDVPSTGDPACTGKPASREMMGHDVRVAAFAHEW